MSIKYTLLEIVQSILSSMDSDEVNSIDDTVESYQIALTCQDVFYDMAVDLGLSETIGLVSLTPSGNQSQPVLMTIPDNVSMIKWMKYNQQIVTDTQPNYVDIDPMNFRDFIQNAEGLFGTVGYVANMSFSGLDGTTYQYTYQTDKPPAYWTSPDAKTILFDSLDTTATGCNDATLQASKLMVGAMLYPAFSLVDTFVPPIAADQFPYFRNKCKVRAFNDFKQMMNQEAFNEARRLKVVTQRNKDRADPIPQIFRHNSRFGRKGPSYNTIFTRAPVERN